MRNVLPYIVECKSSYPFFEQIAAFDCVDAAMHYASDCATVNRRYAYRVLKSNKVLWGGESAQ